MSKDNFSKSRDQSEIGEVGQIRVALVEDDEELREKLAGVVRKAPALRLVGHFPTAESALRRISSLAPDVVVMDLALPGRDGVFCTASLKQQLPKTQVLVLTAFSDVDLVTKALKAGASGYLIKRSAPCELPRAIEEVWEGGSPMSASIARLVVESFREVREDSGNFSQMLTPREESVLRLLSRGFSTKEIAENLFISYPTVRFHLRHIYSKLHVNNRTQAVLKYLQ